MISLDLSNIISEINLDEYKNQVLKIHEDLENKKGKGSEFTGWNDWPLEYDRDEVERIKECAKRLRQISDVVLVCGIGGSYLGAKCAIDMLKGPYNKDKVEVIFCGNTFSSTDIVRLLDYIKDKEVSLNCISKSGKTTETSLAFRIFRKFIEDKYGQKEASKRIVITTDKEKGLLRPLCTKKGYESFIIPDSIGGRFSIITPVGLLPMAIAGIDIDRFITACIAAHKEYSNPNYLENAAYRYAMTRYALYKQGLKSEMYVAYENHLAAIAEWLKQLFGESEGKDGKGLLPTSVINSTDLHSMGQFVQDGSKILFETIINVKKPLADMNFPSDDEDADEMNYLSGKSLAWINKQAMLGTLKAHTEDGKVDNIIINLEDISEESLAYLVYFFFKALAISAYLLDVNPFNQPGVEIYKKNMFKLLGKPNS